MVSDQRTRTRAAILNCIRARVGEDQNTHTLAIASATGIPVDAVKREIDWLSHYDRKHIVPRADGRGWAVSDSPGVTR